MDQEALHILLLIGFHRSNREIGRCIKQEGLMPGQPKILEYLWFHDGAGQKEIGQECIIDKSTVTSLLKRMEKLELIRKETRLDDQRGVSIFLTERDGKRPSVSAKSSTVSTTSCGRASIRKSSSGLWKPFEKSLKIKRNGESNFASYAL